MDRPALLKSWLPPALIAAAAWLIVVCNCDPDGDYPSLGAGPGLTIDEPLNVQQGVFLVQAAQLYGWGLLHPDSVREVFGHPAYLTEYPPLGRLWLGAVHQTVTDWYPPTRGDGPATVASARPASATVFALTVLLVGGFAGRLYGAAGGAVAAAALVLMPRAFGHAHLASVETAMGLAYAAAFVSLARRWTAAAPPTWRSAIWPGFLLGVALLVKIQAILIPLPVAIWAFMHWRRRAVLPLAVWSAAALLVFLAGWPWLWLDPLGHLREYFGRTTDRVVLHTWYLGQRFADHDVPWHYPFVMFLATVPLGLQLLGCWGLAGRRENRQPADALPVSSRWRRLAERWNPAEQLCLAGVVFPLVVFAVPGVAVYDGCRLFLVSFPLWAILIGRGGARCWNWLRKRLSRPAAGGLLALGLVLQGVGLAVTSPCYLSYYNLLVGGPAGARALGFETTYWGDSITRSFLQRVVRAVPTGSTIAVAPVMHQFQVVEMQRSPILRARGIRLQPAGANMADTPWLLVYERRAELPASFDAFEPVEEMRRGGVRLAALLRKAE